MTRPIQRVGCDSGGDLRMTPDNAPCAGCGLPEDRRAFLSDTMGLVMGVLLGLGLSPRRAAAYAVISGTGHRTEGTNELAFPIPTADGAVIDKENQLILVRNQAAVYAFALSCPHQNTALRWLERDKRFQCPKHQSKYEPDGKFISGRATRNMDRLPIRTDGKEVFVDADRVFESDKDPAGWAAAVVRVR